MGVEESSTVESFGSCSAVEMKNGEVVSSSEMSGANREESVRCAVMEDGNMVETAAQIQESAMVAVEDGVVTQQHQECKMSEQTNQMSVNQDKGALEKTQENLQNDCQNKEECAKEKD